MRTVITLCGSTRYKEAFEQWNRGLTLRGYAVFSCGIFGHADGIELTKAQKADLDEIHRTKIRLSQGVVIVNPPGARLGTSTRSERELAERLNLWIFQRTAGVSYGEAFRTILDVLPPVRTRVERPVPFISV